MFGIFLPITYFLALECRNNCIYNYILLTVTLQLCVSHTQLTVYHPLDLTVF